MKTRSEHLEWCKNRAYRYWREGDLANAVVSMMSDLDKHEATRSQSVPYLMVLGGMYASEHDHEAVRKWIEGFR
jgi:hypothetical protein